MSLPMRYLNTSLRKVSDSRKKVSLSRDQHRNLQFSSAMMVTCQSNITTTFVLREIKIVWNRPIHQWVQVTMTSQVRPDKICSLFNHEYNLSILELMKQWWHKSGFFISFTVSSYLSSYLELLSSVQLSGPELRRVDEWIGVDIVEEMASVWYLHPVTEELQVKTFEMIHCFSYFKSSILCFKTGFGLNWWSQTINVFSNQFKMLVLPEAWILLDELYVFLFF